MSDNDDVHEFIQGLLDDGSLREEIRGGERWYYITPIMATLHPVVWQEFCGEVEGIILALFHEGLVEPGLVDEDGEIIWQLTEAGRLLYESSDDTL